MKETNIKQQWEEKENTLQKKNNSQQSEKDKCGIIGEIKNDFKKNPENGIIERKKKICTKCRIEKLLSEFNKHSSTKDKRQSQCKSCTKKSSKNWRKNNPDKVKENYKNRKENDPEYNKKYYYKNKEKEVKRSLKWHKNNPEKSREKSKKWQNNNPDKVKEIKKNWRKNNPDKVKEDNKNWKENNKDAILKYNNNYFKQRRKTDPLFKLSGNIRTMLHKCLKLTNTKKENHTFEILGYTPEKLKLRLEMNFTDKMNWDNYGTYWEIDHKLPIDYLIKKGITDPKIINALLNLQPLTCEKNRSKKNNYEKKYKTIK